MYIPRHPTPITERTPRRPYGPSAERADGPNTVELTKMSPGRPPAGRGMAGWVSADRLGDAQQSLCQARGHGGTGVGPRSRFAIGARPGHMPNLLLSNQVTAAPVHNPKSIIWSGLLTKPASPQSLHHRKWMAGRPRQWTHAAVTTEPSLPGQIFVLPACCPFAAHSA